MNTRNIAAIAAAVVFVLFGLWYVFPTLGIYIIWYQALIILAYGALIGFALAHIMGAR